MDTASPLPLALTLHPLLPLRAPEPGTYSLPFGYQLRLADGPALAAEDPLLHAFGAGVLRLASGPEHVEALQEEAFDPGRRLTLTRHGADDDGDPMIAAWDADGVRLAGIVPYPRSVAIAAALDHGLAVQAVVLTEERALLDDRRLHVDVLVHAPAILRVDLGTVPSLARPDRRRRQRVVLLADGTSELRWWDPSGRGGPLELGDLPVSPELAAELHRLSSAYARAIDDADGLAEDFVDGIERDWTRSALEARTRELWRRARRELGARYAIGLMAPGMTRPAWSVEDDEDDEDIPW